MSISIAQAVQDLLKTVGLLQEAFPKKKFTLDGRLLGDLGEMLVEHHYEVEVFEGIEKYHDGKDKTGRRVQIKATMKDSLTFPAGHVPDYYLGIKINSDGSFEEVFNGPGKVAAKAIEHRKKPESNFHSISILALRVLNETIDSQDRIARRKSEGTGGTSSSGCTSPPIKPLANS